jgi:hypothetical protein
MCKRPLGSEAPFGHLGSVPPCHSRPPRLNAPTRPRPGIGPGSYNIFHNHWPNSPLNRRRRPASHPRHQPPAGPEFASQRPRESRRRPHAPFIDSFLLLQLTKVRSNTRSHTTRATQRHTKPRAPSLPKIPFSPDSYVPSACFKTQLYSMRLAVLLCLAAVCGSALASRPDLFDASGDAGRALLQDSAACGAAIQNCNACRYQFFRGTVTRAICTACGAGFVPKALGTACCESLATRHCRGTPALSKQPSSQGPLTAQLPPPSPCAAGWRPTPANARHDLPQARVEQPSSPLAHPHPLQGAPPGTGGRPRTIATSAPTTTGARAPRAPPRPLSRTGAVVT